MISDKAQKMARDVPLTNIYNMSTNNWTPNKYLTNIVGELNNRKENHWGVDVSPTTEVWNYYTDTAVVAKDAQESEDNKSYKICDNMFIKTYKV